ncbi:MAG: hypothetical protein HQL52_17155 [Magnetococcales bacterium]|nr:hypothetical protein [Magnetococcales bacterium]
MNRGFSVFVIELVISLLLLVIVLFVGAYFSDRVESVAGLGQVTRSGAPPVPGGMPGISTSATLPVSPGDASQVRQTLTNLIAQRRELTAKLEGVQATFDRLCLDHVGILATDASTDPVSAADNQDSHQQTVDPVVEELGIEITDLTRQIGLQDEQIDLLNQRNQDLEAMIAEEQSSFAGAPDALPVMDEPALVIEPPVAQVEVIEPTILDEPVVDEPVGATVTAIPAITAPILPELQPEQIVPAVVEAPVVATQSPGAASPQGNTSADALAVRESLLGALHSKLGDLGVDVRADAKEGVLYLPNQFRFKSASNQLGDYEKQVLSHLGEVFISKLPCYAGRITPGGSECEGGASTTRLDAVIIEGHSSQAPVGSSRFRANWNLATQRGIGAFYALMEVRPELTILKNDRQQTLFQVAGRLVDRKDTAKRPKGAAIRLVMTGP